MEEFGSLARQNKISIVTPSFNQAQFIGECLDSVRLQHFPSVEHIVRDGGSSDGTISILEKYSSEVPHGELPWVSEPDRGQSDALNRGFRAASGDIVGWLNSDDRYRPGCLAAVDEAFSKNPDVDILYGDYTWIDESGRILKIRREIEFSQFILSYHRVLYIPSTATFFRRRIFDEGHFLDTRYHYAMDSEFFLRLAHKGYRFKHEPKLLADFRWHSESKSGLDPRKHLAEHDAIALHYSKAIQRLRSGTSRRLAFGTLRLAAGMLRYSEKMLRGYYLEQMLEQMPLFGRGRVAKATQ